MNKDQAKNTIKSVFSNEFDKANFTDFANNLLHSAHFDSYTIQGSQIPDQYKEQIHSLERLATFLDSNGKSIDLLIVTLLKDTALDRARTMQRNFIAQYLDTVSKNGALVAFVSPLSHCCAVSTKVSTCVTEKICNRPKW